MKYTITTLGCKVNQYETQAIESFLRERGHERCDSNADFVIINTCAVTAESGRKSRQAVRRARAESPGALVAVCGCFSQVSPDEIRELGADIIYGSGDRERLVGDIESALADRRRIENLDDPFKRKLFESLPAGAIDGRTRAFLKIEDGCDNFCSYCVIPYARGRVRSLPASEAAAQARALEGQGFRELVITGIEISSYGKDLRDGTGLIDCIESIAAAAPGLRLRLGSIEPTVITADFVGRLAAIGTVCPHFHLSLQSGSDAVLAAMRRRYDTAQFYAAAELLRERFPGCALTADLICGFPGETESEHQETLDFIERCAFASMHIFPYSPRPGTRAAELPGQHSRAVKAGRAQQAQLVAERMGRQYLEGCVGGRLSVLFESEEEGVSLGHADNYAMVSAGGTGLRGLVKTVEISGILGEILVGNVI